MIEFLFWTLLLYLTHRLIHVIPYLRTIHADHHVQVHFEQVGWNWKNLFLFVDTVKSTADQWITEVVPTLIFCWLTGAWWIAIFYYVWAAFVQEIIEHNKNFNLYPFLTSGKWHLVHHSHPKNNYGVFIPVWDIFLGTFRSAK